MKKNLGVIIAAVALVFALVAYFNAGGVEVTKEVVREFGVAAGPDHTERQFFLSNFVNGGEVVATSSTAATYTLTTAELRDKVGYISWTPNVNTTLTTMASTSAPLVGLKTGQTFEVTFYNASSTAASTVTFAAGTGVDLQELEGGSVIVNGLEGATLKFVKKSDSDVMLLVAPFQVAD